MSWEREPEKTAPLDQVGAVPRVLRVGDLGGRGCGGRMTLEQFPRPRVLNSSSAAGRGSRVRPAFGAGRNAAYAAS